MSKGQEQPNLCTSVRGTISTRNLSGLPEITTLRRLCQSLAMLDSIMIPPDDREFDFRCYLYDSDWKPGRTLAKMDNGSGDEMYVWFGATGAAIKGFNHEAEMTPYKRDLNVYPGVLNSVPPEFAQCLDDLSFDPAAITFFTWRHSDDDRWHVGNISFPDNFEDPDGSEQLLYIYDGEPDTYQLWAESYYEKDVSIDAVFRIYEHEPLSKELVAELNEDASFEELRRDAVQIGYPL